MVYSSDREQIANYNTSSGGWQSLTTRAESQFLRDSNNIYKQVYDAARAEMNAAKPCARFDSSIFSLNNSGPEGRNYDGVPQMLKSRNIWDCQGGGKLENAGDKMSLAFSVPLRLA